MPDDEIDMRMLVNSGTDDDGEPNLRPWLSLKDDLPDDPPKGKEHPASRRSR